MSSDRGVVERSSNLGWLKVPLGEMIGRRLGGMPVHVENISNAAALAEKNTASVGATVTWFLSICRWASVPGSW